jgi:hypothetical protein
MPLKFWDKAFSTAAHIINRLPSRVIEFPSPFEKLFGTKPDYSWLKVFGCACWPHLRPYNTRKLEFHSKQCVFLGYNSCHKGYKCLDVATGRVYISRDVMFDENDFPFLQFHSNAGAQLRAKILLLPPTLRNYHGDDLVDGHLAHGANPVADQVTENHGVLVDEHGHSALDIGRSMDPLATTDLSESSLDHTPDNGLRSAPGSGLNSTSRGQFRA